MTIAAEAVVAATPEAVFRFLSDLENHWRLAGRWIEVVEIGERGGRVRMKGPLGIRRTATTRVDGAQPQHRMSGTAELSGGTLAHVRWELNEDAGGTRVRLAADVEHATAADRLLLAAGGAAWMRRRFRRILERLGAAL